MMPDGHLDSIGYTITQRIQDAVKAAAPVVKKKEKELLKELKASKNNLDKLEHELRSIRAKGKKKTSKQMETLMQLRAEVESLQFFHHMAERGLKACKSSELNEKLKKLLKKQKMSELNS
jgi:predicted Zn-dependent peptidase